MKKLKFIIFILLIILFIVSLFYSIFGTSLSYLSLEEIKENRKLNNKLINKIKINNLETIYNKNNNIYYYSVSKDYENNLYVLNIELESDYKYKIIDKTLNIIRVDYKEPINIIIYNDKYYYETKIQLTNLPIINIETEDEITNLKIKSNFKYINSNNTEKMLNHNIKINVRGNSSKYFDKKSYRINFYNKKYTKDKKVYISNFYYGDSLILDSVYRDSSKIRNLLATELWNDISDDFNNIDIYSEFVEVFINNEYKGLYVLTEPINRTKLNLNKSNNLDTSIILKVQQWESVKKDINFSNITDDFYFSYELKYPNDEELFSISWNKILNKIADYYDLNYKSSYETIKSTWNIENYIDMIIYNAFINNSDNNLYKNNYLYINSLKSEEVFIQPWDMEYSFGIKFCVKDDYFMCKNMEDYNEIYTGFIHKNAPEINDLLIKRYKELRKNILTQKYFDKKLDSYINFLTKGSSKRDSEKWYEYDIQTEIEEIRVWIYNRLDYFDDYIESLENEEL